MGFDIVASLLTLPDLVVATVLEFLPVSLVVALGHSANGLLRALAQAQQWRWVCVGGHRLSGYHVVSHHEFNQMVRTNAPPPGRIRNLRYCMTSTETNPLFMTPAWRRYLADHAETISLFLGVRDGHPWQRAAPRIAELNLVELRLLVPCGDAMATPLTSMEFPNTLKRLHLGVCCWEDEVLHGVVVPLSVVHFEIDTDRGLSPTRLPLLPQGLRKLRFRVEDGADMTPHVGVLPRSLEQLDLDVTTHPPRVLVEAMRRFSPGLRHNMVMFAGGVDDNRVPGLVRVNSTMFSVDLTTPGNYSQVMLPPGSLLRVYDRALARHLRPPVSFLSISHWFSSLKVLVLMFPFSLRGAEIPLSVDVMVHAVGCGLAPEVWDIPRITCLVTGPFMLDTPSPRLARMLCLTTLSLTLGKLQERVRVPAPPNLEYLRISLLKGAFIPDLRSFVTVQTLELEGLPLALQFEPELVPPNITSMLLDVSHQMVIPPPPKYDPFMRPVHLRHLERLETLSLVDMPRVYLGNMEFPESLTLLKCHGVHDLRLDRVAFPPRLETLKMEKCGLVNPWTAGPRNWVRKMRRPVVVYPDSLSSLILNGNTGMQPPPPQFVYPPQLSYLSLRECGILDIAQFRFPEILCRLDLDGNNFPIPEEYEWPLVPSLVVKRKRDWNSPSLSQQEFELLQRKIPGVHINL